MHQFDNHFTLIKTHLRTVNRNTRKAWILNDFCTRWNNSYRMNLLSLVSRRFPNPCKWELVNCTTSDMITFITNFWRRLLAITAVSNSNEEGLKICTNALKWTNRFSGKGRAMRISVVKVASPVRKYEFLWSFRKCLILWIIMTSLL